MTGRGAPADGTHRRAPDGFTRWPDIEPLEVQISSGQARLAIDLRGGNLRRLVVGDWDVLDGYPAGTIPAGRSPTALAESALRRSLRLAGFDVTTRCRRAGPPHCQPRAVVLAALV
jgi:hypothetical protein